MKIIGNQVMECFQAKMTLKQAAAQLGVTALTLRRWEDRLNIAFPRYDRRKVKRKHVDPSLMPPPLTKRQTYFVSGRRGGE